MIEMDPCTIHVMDAAVEPFQTSETIGISLSVCNVYPIISFYIHTVPVNFTFHLEDGGTIVD